MSELIHGFTIKSKNPLPEFNAVGVYAVHKKTGLELYHILNDDEENLFSYNFMTSAPDSKGAAHITEHTVLCGSKNYPLKDPFMVLAKQSVNTFLNAMTYPDKTVYPASSTVEADYFNLMSVYGDAVFFPNLDKWAFEQEGHRFEIDETGKMTVQGVVLNEMRANYSDFDGVMYDWVHASLCRKTVYEKDSGGSPLEIPDLTYEQYRAFYKKYYHPVNCRVFLMGNIPTEKQMKFLEEKFLCHFEAAQKPDFLPPIPRYERPVYLTVPAPVGDGAVKDAVMLNWLLPETASAVNLMESYLIGEILIGHGGAYLNKRLLDSKIGEDLYPYNGIGKSIKNITFTLGMKGVEKERHTEFEKTVFEALRKIVQEGVSAKDTETAVHSIDFSNREIKRSYGPFALSLMERAMAGWSCGKSPESALEYVPAFEKVKACIKNDKNYITGLIKKYLLDNKHYSLVSVYPDKDFCTRLDESLEKRAERFDKTLSKADRAAFLTKQKETNIFKQTPDSTEKRALIPSLSKKDLPPLPSEPAQEISFIHGIPVVVHEQPTNDIGYFELAFPADTLQAEDYRYLPLLSACITGLGTTSLSWSEAAACAANVLGGFYAHAAVFSKAACTSREAAKQYEAEHIVGRDWLIVGGKMLGELVPQAATFVFGLLRNLSFDDTSRLIDLITRLKNDFESLPAMDGNSLAVLRAAANFSEKNAKRELLSGISQITFLRSLYDDIKNEEKIGFLRQKLQAVFRTIFDSGLIVNLIGTKQNITDLKKALQEHLCGLKPPISKSRLEFVNRFAFGSAEKNRLELIRAPLQVGFAVSVFRSALFGTKEYAHEAVLCRLLSTPLWEKIRSIGGAYGAYAAPMGLEGLLAFVTYRDPNPINSLSEFLHAIDYALSETVTEEELDRLITGRYSKEIMPTTPAGKGFVSFKNLLCGISYGAKQDFVSNMLDTSAADLRICAQKLLEQKKTLSAAVLASESAIKNTESVQSFLSNHRYSESL